MGKTNIVMLIGNLGKDVELKYFDNGGCVGRTSMATTEKYKNKNTGETVENTSWHNLLFSGKGAEIVAKYTKKGSKLFVSGSINYRSWESDGKTNYMTEIKVKEFEFLDSKSGAVIDDATKQSTTTKKGGKNNGSAVDAYIENQEESSNLRGDNESEDDLPF